MNLSAKDLEAYTQSMARAKPIRMGHVCADCEDGRENGSLGCARHTGRCVGCGSEAIEIPDEHTYEDGVSAYWCWACVHRDEEVDTKRSLEGGPR